MLHFLMKRTRRRMRTRRKRMNVSFSKSYLGLVVSAYYQRACQIWMNSPWVLGPGRLALEMDFALS